MALWRSISIPIIQCSIFRPTASTSFGTGWPLPTQITVLWPTSLVSTFLIALRDEHRHNLTATLRDEVHGCVAVSGRRPRFGTTQTWKEHQTDAAASARVFRRRKALGGLSAGRQTVYRVC